MTPRNLNRREAEEYVGGPSALKLLEDNGLRPFILGTGKGGRQILFSRPAIDAILDELEAAGTTINLSTSKP